jgi:hypothetical protein
MEVGQGPNWGCSAKGKNKVSQSNGIQEQSVGGEYLAGKG